MLILAQANEADIVAYGRELLQAYRNELDSLEAAAQVTAESIFKSFHTEKNSPLFALVRIFRFGPQADVPEELLSQTEVTSDYWLTLMGTYGVEENWCHRTRSVGHQLIPADSPATPMLREAFAQIGLKFGYTSAEGDLNLQGHRVLTVAKYFHVEEALGSKYIPDQDGFVVPYGIRSAVGIGTPFRDGSSYMCIAFATETITARNASMFNNLNPFLGILLAPYNQARIWI